MELEYWEYKFVSISIDKGDLEETSFGEEVLNGYGKDRWEAVNFQLDSRPGCFNGGNFAKVLMKRRIIFKN